MDATQPLTPEQQQELKEKISKMSPEELREFQKKQCIFCSIIEGKIPSKKVYEDEFCLAIMDINPGNAGHLLLLPKEHYSIMPQIPDNILAHLFKTTKMLSKSLLKALKAQGTTIFVANGISAGQRAQHFMIHIIPRMENDNLDIEIEEKRIDKKKAEDAYEKIVEKVEESFGIDIPRKKRVVDADFEEEETKKEENDDEEDDKVSLDDITKLL